MTHERVEEKSVGMDVPVTIKPLTLVFPQAALLPTPPLTESVPTSPLGTFDDRVLLALPKKGLVKDDTIIALCAVVLILILGREIARKMCGNATERRPYLLKAK
ncbi:unnamed protein product [Rhizoctonia solani]|uniref:Uncharacterized protein n=1 Tax=Rhizoctonia solani TaxID=456999 RepID=A0A8H2WGC8_9AGAM|nr:unnamed protein product [Rhizoctonia solani]